jgi:hypothetical protein
MTENNKKPGRPKGTLKGIKEYKHIGISLETHTKLMKIKPKELTFDEFVKLLIACYPLV